MKFKYGIGIVTFFQFIVLSLLGIANGLNSIVTTCHAHGSDCISNTLVSVIFFILTTAWFAFIWILGYTAQERRSRRLASVLIAAELLIMLVAYFNATHHTDWLSLVTSIIDLVLASVVILLAIRLILTSQSGGSSPRQTSAGRPRQRRRR